MTAPKVDNYINYLSRNGFSNTTPAYDGETRNNIDQIFVLLSCIENN